MNALNALRRIDMAHERMLARAGMKHNAFFEELIVRHIRRSDDANQAPFVMGNIPIGPVARASMGTDAVHVAGSLYVTEINVPFTKMITGVGVLNGTIVGTDLLIVALFNAKGVKLATSALAGTLGAGADAFQQIPFTTPYQLKTDGRYHVAVQCNGVTHATQRIAANTYLNRASIIAGVFGTIPGAIAVPTGITADAGPICYLY